METLPFISTLRLLVLSLSSLASPIEEILSRVSERYAIYDWMGAAELLSKAFASTSLVPDLKDQVRLSEMLAESYFKAAFQARDNQEFSRIMALSRNSYSNASDANRRIGLQAKSRMMSARKAFAEYWLTADVDEMKRKMQLSVSISREAVAAAEEEKDRLVLANALKDQLEYLWEIQNFSRDSAEMSSTFERGVSIGEAAITNFEGLGDDQGLLEALYFTTHFLILGSYLVGPEQFKNVQRKSAVLGERIRRVADTLGTPYALALRNDSLAKIAHYNESNSAEALRLLQEGAQQAFATKDSYLCAGMCGIAGFYAGMAAGVEEDIEKKRHLFEIGIGFCEQVSKDVEVSHRPQLLNFNYACWAEPYTDLARFVEVQVDSKRTHLLKAIELARKGMKYETKDAWANAGHPLAKALYTLATLSSDPSEKKQLLLEALPLREEQVRLTNLQVPGSFEVAIGYNYLALVRAELSTLEQDPTLKLDFLQKAISDMEKCLEIGSKWEAHGNLPGLAWYAEWYGDILLKLYNLNSDPTTARISIDNYRRSIQYLKKTGQVSPQAGILWKIARVDDILGSYAQASEAFEEAGEVYEQASKKLSGSSSVFGDLARYMRAWRSIEEARVHHAEGEYSAAAEGYADAARKLETTQTWKHLAGHYEACSSLEKAEAQSNKENHEASLDSFNTGLRSFKQTHRNLVELIQNNGREDRHDLNNWAEITKGRERYCEGRMLLEQAVLSDKKGNQQASSRQYAQAREIFDELTRHASSELARQEFETLTNLSDAWSKMKEAEVKASAELYSEAARSFERVRDVTMIPKSRLYAVASASICHALESGTKFRQTRNLDLYAEIKKNLETAADYYGEAGLESAAHWTRATQRMFDALVYLSSAETEMESKKKSELYHLAEKHLQLAATLFEKAGYQSKKEGALRHLVTAQEEKELLLTPMEALAENPAITKIAVAPASLLRDQPVGLEKFDAACVVGNMDLPQKECNVGADLTLEVELANVGKTSATLIKLENIAPNGLEVNRETSPDRLQDNYLDFKGKRLDHMKSHEVKVSLRAKRKGKFEIRPRILFVDEGGSYKSYEFEPATINVRELGISALSEGGRRLAVIMFTDIAGYTALSQRDEKHALKVLEKHNDLLRPIFAKHGGIEIKTIGDSFLVEFVSALAATECAIEIQQMLAGVNKDMEGSPIMVRIGLHLGDVIGRGNDIFGDAVNIASRIQPLAEPGGICVSEGVYSVIRNKISYAIEMVPAVSLKNVELPMNVYTIAPLSSTGPRHLRSPTIQ